MLGGNLPKGQGVFHHCDNPPCCNPKHLFSGPNKLNTADMMAKGRNKVLKGEESPCAKLNENQVRQIRAMRDSGKFSNPEIAKIFNVTPVTVSQIGLRKSWKHLD